MVRLRLCHCGIQQHDQEHDDRWKVAVVHGLGHFELQSFRPLNARFFRRQKFLNLGGSTGSPDHRLLRKGLRAVFEDQ